MTFKLPQNPQGDWASIIQQQEAEAAALAARQLAQRMAIITEEVKVQTGYFAQLGWLGRSFSEAFNKAAAPIDVDPKKTDCRATLWTHGSISGFLREITLGKGIVMDSNPLAIFGALTHEGTHLVNQFERVPATHASPYNTRSPVVLCPRDAVVLNILIERQAFAMELLMDDLLAEARKSDSETYEVPPASVLQVKLQEYAQMKNTRTRWESEDAFLDSYRGGKMSDYEPNGRADYLKNGNIGYVRLGLADLRILNDCFGMKTFGETDEDLSKLLTSDFTPEQQARLDQINSDLGVGNEEDLPLLEDALAAHGMTIDAYLKMSTSRIAPEPAPQTALQAPSDPKTPPAANDDDLAPGVVVVAAAPKLALA